MPSPASVYSDSTGYCVRYHGRAGLQPVPACRGCRRARIEMTAAEELLEIIMRRYERASTLLTSNRPVEDWGKLLGDSAAVSATPQ